MRRPPTFHLLILLLLTLASLPIAINSLYLDTRGEHWGPPVWILRGQVCYASSPLKTIDLGNHAQIHVFKESITLQIHATHIVVGYRHLSIATISLLMATVLHAVATKLLVAIKRHFRPSKTPQSQILKS